jgi:hypothetical protein
MTIPHFRRTFPPFCAALLIAGCGTGGTEGGTSQDDGTTSDSDALGRSGSVTLTTAFAPTTAQAGQDVSLTATVASTRSAVTTLSIEVKAPDGGTSFKVDVPAQLIGGRRFSYARTLHTQPSDPAGTYTLSATVKQAGTGKTLATRSATYTLRAGSCASADCSPGTCQETNGKAACACPSDYQASGLSRIPITKPGGGRSFLLGMYSDGSEIPSYKDYLGYPPEVTYDHSYQWGHHQDSCGEGIDDMTVANKRYPTVPAIFTAAFNGGPDWKGSESGAYDGCYEKVFNELKKSQDVIYAVRIDHEFNNYYRDKIPSAADFKASFNRIVSIGRRILPARVKFIFNPNWDKNLGDYVPEGADIIGVDVYNNGGQGSACPGWTSTKCAQEKFVRSRAGSIAYWTDIAQKAGKPIALPEWGDDYGDGVFIDMVADWAFDKVLVTPGKSNNVVYIGYWDSPSYEDAHLRGNAKTVFQKRFANIPYGGTYWLPLLPTTSYANYD